MSWQQTKTTGPCWTGHAPSLAHHGESPILLHFCHVTATNRAPLHHFHLIMTIRLQDTQAHLFHHCHLSCSLLSSHYHHPSFSTLPTITNDLLSLSFATSQRRATPLSTIFPTSLVATLPSPTHGFNPSTAAMHLSPIGEGCEDSGWGLDGWVRWSSGMIRVQKEHSQMYR